MDLASGSPGACVGHLLLHPSHATRVLIHGLAQWSGKWLIKYFYSVFRAEEEEEDALGFKGIAQNHTPKK